MYYLEFLELIRIEYQNLEIEKYKPLIENEKIIIKKENDEKSLLLIWFCLSVIEAKEIFHKAFLLLKTREYYKAWNELAQVEVIMHNIKYNVPDYMNYIACKFIKINTIKLQKIFPYRLFTSMVFIVTDDECSICGKSMNPFSGCEHIRGKVYSGELCISIVKDGNWISHDIVEKPAIKSAVLFDGLDDPEKYKLLEFIIPKLPNEYIRWDYNILTKYEPHSKYIIERNELCPCLSGKKYKDCCMNNPKGIKYDHYEFLLPDNLLDQDQKVNG